MEKVDVVPFYERYFVDNDFERADLFETLRAGFDINSVLYPGSFVHTTPSFFFPYVVYVDSDQRARRFFEQHDSVADLMSERKTYGLTAEFRFMDSDHSDPLDLEEGSFDLVISQYAGLVSQSCKMYLRVGGILLANNSHGDAGVARIDDDYEFIAAVHVRRGRHHITDKDLDSYFVPKRGVSVTREHLKGLGKGIGYTKTANSHIFRKVS